MIDPKALLKDLKGQVKALEADLRVRAADTDLPFAAELRAEHKAAFDAKRTAAPYQSWLDERITQSAVAWVLGTVFLRFCEDNGLLGEQRFLGGTGDAIALAAETQADWVLAGDKPRTDRDWIEHGFAAMSVSPVARGLFDRRHNPMYKVTPSHQAAKALIAFWRTEKEPGVPVHDFTSEDWDTRFLGDLYQDLSESARKTYALLQTPEFIEEFILDLTLDPAIEEFGYKDLRCIDPTCGSGHFLLGAFKRLLAVWDEKSPGVDRTDRIAAALRSVHGVDKNPFAVAIARFRMLIAAMWEDRRETGNGGLAGAPNFEINVAVGDSLLHGRGAAGQQGELFNKAHVYGTEDVGDYIRSCDILGVGSYHVVFGNPPYKPVSDKNERDNYRAAYKSCSGRWVLSVPFVERFFQLGILDKGYVGQITANSFMKREFGERLVQEYLAYQACLTHVIDTSGVRIPGHGTPTVILIGRRLWKTPETTIRAVLGIQDEPDEPVDYAQGVVWRSIVENLNYPGVDTPWVSVVDLPRAQLRKHPWSLSGGGGIDLLRKISDGHATLKSTGATAGIESVTGEDDLYLLPLNRRSIKQRLPSLKTVVEGEGVRDYAINSGFGGVWVYDDTYARLPPAKIGNELRFLEPNKKVIERRRRFGVPILERGLEWWEWQELYIEKLRTPLSIAFAEIATHPHFSLDRRGRLFKRTAPVIKLGSEDLHEHLGLIGVLNSSTAAFWLKKVCHPKGGSGMGRGIQDEAWEGRYSFNASNVEEFPLPAKLPGSLSVELDALARQLSESDPVHVCAREKVTSDRLAMASAEAESIRGRMVALQEELDWEVYRLYGLVGEEEAADQVPSADVPRLKLGERAFEIVLARQVASGAVTTAWFQRHGSKPVTEIPQHWPEAYKRVVENRIKVIETNRDIGLIERPEYKRRWQQESWEKREKAALRDWLLDRCEERGLWFVTDDSGREQPRAMTVAALAETLRSDADFVSVVRLYAGDDAKLDDVLAGLVEAEHVPYLAGFRYKESGLRKRAQWEDTWDKQREEDATGKSLDIPVPPKYTSADFRKPSYWSNRGKLDVPKERFISYPEANPDHVPGSRSKPTSLLLGWAGWDHREQAHALMTIIEERKTQDGWDVERLRPLLAGLVEVMPWVKQWHGDVDPEFGLSPYEQYNGYLQERLRSLGLTVEDVKRRA